MEDARNQKVTEEHDVIDDAIKDRGEGYTVFSIVGHSPHFLVMIFMVHVFSPSACCTAHQTVSSKIPKVRTILGRRYVSI